MLKLSGKKLLILGGKTILVDIVKRAKELGVYTVVVDNNPLEKSPAKMEADKYYNISFAEIDKMVEIIRAEKIDGVLTGFSDSYLKFYIEICEASGLPCYGDLLQFEIATNKAAFKKACIAAGVPVIPGKETLSAEDAREEANKQGYPVFLKPADNSGSRGVIKCDSEEDIEAAFHFAYKYSTNGLVIVEKYMNCENIAVSYYIANGEIRLAATNERRLHIAKETGSSITSYAQYPSIYTDRYINEVDKSVKKLLKDNNFKNGMVSFQAFVDDDSFYFCEMCFRPSGGHHYFLIEDQSSVDEMGLLIEFALTGDCGPSWNKERENPYFRETCAMLHLIGTPGKKICKFEGVNRVQNRDDVIEIIPMLSTGDTIGADGTTAQVLATIWYKCKNGVDPIYLAHEIAEELVIEDEFGENLSRISIM